MNNTAVQIPLYFWLMLIAALVVIVARWFRLPYASALVITGLAVGLSNLLPRAISVHGCFFPCCCRLCSLKRR